VVEEQKNGDKARDNGDKTKEINESLSEKTGDRRRLLSMVRDQHSQTAFSLTKT
jgi:hypothetical protein